MAPAARQFQDRPAGDDKATSSGLCTISQRQEFVAIRLKGGQPCALKPIASSPKAFFDERGEPAKREMLAANRGQIYRLGKQSIFVFCDIAPYKKAAASSAPVGGSPTGNPPEVVKLLLGLHQVKFDGGCRVNFNKAGKYFSKTPACDAAKVGIAEEAIHRYSREQGSMTH